jgi:hypothetical protein
LYFITHYMVRFSKKKEKYFRATVRVHRLYFIQSYLLGYTDCTLYSHTWVRVYRLYFITHYTVRFSKKKEKYFRATVRVHRLYFIQSYLFRVHRSYLIQSYLLGCTGCTLSPIIRLGLAKKKKSTLEPQLG